MPRTIKARRNKKGKKGKRGKTRKQKVMYMIGCSKKGGSNSQGCGSQGCPLAPLAMKGGNFYKAATPIPGPFVGKPWGAAVNEWPTMDGIGGNRNYFNLSNVAADPQLQMSMNDSGYNNIKSMGWWIYL